MAEAVGLAAWFVIFARLHSLVGGDAATATRNARTLQTWEHRLHLAVEPAANRWLAQHGVLIEPSVYIYRGYYLVLLAVLVWLYLRHPARYPQLRRSLVAMMALVLPIWWAVPMSPPRFAIPGIVDIVAEHDLFGSTASSTLSNGQNHYSAMPSMHVAFAAWCGYAVWSVVRREHPETALLAWVFPALMVAVVFGTGNHYVLDVVGSAVLLGVAISVAAAIGRRGRTGSTERSSHPHA